MVSLLGRCFYFLGVIDEMLFQRRQLDGFEVFLHRAGLDNVLSGRLSDLRGTLEEMGSASMRLADSQVCEQMVLLVRTLLTLLSNADEQRRAQQRPSELPKQQARILQPQHVQNRQHLPHEQKPGCKIGPPQQQVIGSSLKQAPQQQGWLQNRPQAGSHNESTNQPGTLPEHPAERQDQHGSRAPGKFHTNATIFVASCLG